MKKYDEKNSKQKKMERGRKGGRDGKESRCRGWRRDGNAEMSHTHTHIILGRRGAAN